MIMPLFQRLAVNGNCFCDIVICDLASEEVLFVEQKFMPEDEVTLFPWGTSTGKMLQTLPNGFSCTKLLCILRCTLIHYNGHLTV